MMRVMVPFIAISKNLEIATLLGLVEPSKNDNAERCGS